MNNKNKGLPPGISKVGKYYRVRSRTDKNGHRLQTNVRTLEKAIVKAKEFENLIINEINLQSNKAQLSLMFTDYMNQPDQKTLTYKWRAQKLQNFKSKLLAYFGNIQISKITSSNLDGFIKFLINKNYSHSLIKQNKELIMSILKHAQEKNAIARVPSIKMPKYKKVYERDRVNKDDLKKFFMELKKERLEPAILLIAFTGVRASECTGLKWSNYDTKNNTFSILSQIATKQDGTRGPRHVKNHRTRSIPIVDNYLIESLKKWAINQSKEFEKRGLTVNNDTHIFTRVNGNFYKYPSTLLHAIKRVCNNAKIRNLVTHELRHNLASNLIEVANPEYVKYVMGHKSIKTTYDFYVHPDQKQLKKEFQKLPINHE